MPASVKVLQVTREMPGEQRYGLGKSVAQLNVGLAEAGAAVGYFCAADLPPPAAAQAQQRARRWAMAHGEALHGLFEVVSLAWETGRQAAALACSQGYSHVHCHDAVVAHGYRSVGEASAPPMGYTQHGFHTLAKSIHRHVVPLPSALAAQFDQLESQSIDQADWVVFLTGLGAREVTADLGLPMDREQICVIPHARPRWPGVSRARARAALGWDPREHVVLAVGQLIGLKRLDWVLRACAQAATPWRLVILGEGDLAPLLRVAESLGVTPPLVMATDQPEIYFAAADVFTSASATESFGMAHLEAMMSGLPVACTAVGGVPELMGDAGLLLPDDEAAYASGLVHVLQTPELRQQLAAASVARAAAWPDTAAIAERHLQMYRRANPSSRSRATLAEPFSA